ncbi:Homeobox protein knotted-1-like 2 [Cucurbita argyrosperma subsp. argyrosperma]|nr:Homeobox protein knotted-1-like 2 [Cucurbita argyrosperma subsp. argyrosperma]
MDSGNHSTDQPLRVQLQLKHEEEDDGVDGEMLRRRISSHPLYGLLLETHLNCLKVGGIGELDRGYLAMDLMEHRENEIRCLNTLNQSELDRFMESYCYALSKLKEAMEESQLKSMAFINSMNSQLRELTATGAAAKKPTAASSSAATSDTK